jgi:hypothetical protein
MEELLETAFSVGPCREVISGTVALQVVGGNEKENDCAGEGQQQL